MRKCVFHTLRIDRTSDLAVPSTTGKKQLAMEAFAKALRALPATIAENGGYDSAEIVANLRAAHAQGDKRAGIDMNQGIIGNMVELGICESFKLKEHVLMAAAEAAAASVGPDHCQRLGLTMEGLTQG